MILRYHGFTDWQTKYLETDDLTTVFTFGFELEVQRERDCPISCEELSNLLQSEFHDLFVYERDGSIGDGVEIISQPMTWSWFQANISQFKKLLNILVENKFRSHNGGACGLHIHVGKQCLGLSEIERESLEELLLTELAISKKQMDKETKIIINIQYILERFQNEIYAFSRRRNNDYARPLTDLKVLSNGTEVIQKEEIKSLTRQGLRGCSNRYMNLNLKNEHTIEFRMFRGTLLWTTFYSSINMIKNIVDMAKISRNLITFKALVLSNLTEEDKEICIEYCADRGIELESNKVVQLASTEINYKKKIDKQELYRKVICEMN